MATVNTHTIVGYMGRDPELKKVKVGDTEKSLCNFSIATEEWVGKNADGTPKYATTWHNCTAWGQQADYMAKYGKKGALASVTGPNVANMGKDKDGNEKEFRGIQAKEVTVFTTKGGESGNSSSSSSNDSGAAAASEPTSNTTSTSTTTAAEPAKTAAKSDNSAATALPF